MRPLFLGTVCLFLCSGCHGLAPKPIASMHRNLPAALIEDPSPSIERGKPMPVLDTVGWVVGIPGKILLWDRRVDNHRISAETECVVADYLDENALAGVKVRLNQYAPLEDWHRLRKNTSVAWPWRYSLGTLSVLGEAVIPGRLFGGDHYNPFTATVHLYSDIPAIGLHEAAHAKDFARRHYPGTYAAVYLIPGVPLYHESVATRDVFAYVEYRDESPLIREAYRILYPAYGTYVGDSLGYFAPRYSTPLYFSGVIGGHAIGYWKAKHVREALQTTEAGLATPIDGQFQSEDWQLDSR